MSLLHLTGPYSTSRETPMFWKRLWTMHSQSERFTTTFCYLSDSIRGSKDNCPATWQWQRMTYNITLDISGHSLSLPLPFCTIVVGLKSLYSRLELLPTVPYTLLQQGGRWHRSQWSPGCPNGNMLQPCLNLCQLHFRASLWECGKWGWNLMICQPAPWMNNKGARFQSKELHICHTQQI